MIKGFRFTNQLANAEIDARIHQEFLNKNDGIFYGMDINNTNNSITISEGLCEIAGRPVAVIGDETIQTSSEELYCVLVLEIDLSKESTSSVFEQVSFKILTSSISYPTVTKQDINIYNGDNNIYQLEFARFRTSIAGIKEFKDTRTFLNFKGIYDQIKKECEKIISEIKKELENVENGSRYFLKAQELTNQDLNDYIAEGAYYAQGGNNVLNKPSGINQFGMFIYRTAGFLYTQLLISNQKIFYRTVIEGKNWSEWIKISTEGHTHDIKISGAIKGSTSFDESGNIIINASQNNVFTLTGSFTLKASSNPGTFQLNTKNITYPAGLNKDNCIVLCFLGRHNTSKGWSAYQDALQDSSSMLSATTGRSIVLNNDNITIRAYNNQSSDTVLYYKIALMKIS